MFYKIAEFCGGGGGNKGALSLPHLKSQIRTGQRLESGEELLAGIVYGEAHLAAGEEFHISGLAAGDGGNMNQRDAGHGRFRGGQTARLGDKTSQAAI